MEPLPPSPGEATSKNPPVRRVNQVYLLREIVAAAFSAIGRSVITARQIPRMAD
jgi:hypothetical protein